MPWLNPEGLEVEGLAEAANPELELLEGVDLLPSGMVKQPLSTQITAEAEEMDFAAETAFGVDPATGLPFKIKGA
jgi:hypothetical protein